MFVLMHVADGRGARRRNATRSAGDRAEGGRTNAKENHERAGAGAWLEDAESSFLKFHAARYDVVMRVCVRATRRVCVCVDERVCVCVDDS